jgi:hypothetical protein
MGETKLLVQCDDLSVKIEVNTVIRGTVHPTQTRALTAAASDALMADLELPLLSPEDIYGGKLVAAMDRQHPRDLFDVMELFAHGGITPQIRRAFVVYLASGCSASCLRRSTRTNGSSCERWCARSLTGRYCEFRTLRICRRSGGDFRICSSWRPRARRDSAPWPMLWTSGLQKYKRVACHG